MTTTRTLADLSEPAYILLGSVLPQERAESIDVAVSSTSVVRYDAEARPMLQYFSRIRTRAEALLDIREWEGTPDDLDLMVREGLLVFLPSADQADMIGALGELAVIVTAPARIASDERSVLLLIGDERAIALDPLTASVLSTSGFRSLDFGVGAVSQETGVAPDRLWSLVLYDLDAILETGAGYLARAEDPR